VSALVDAVLGLPGWAVYLAVGGLAFGEAAVFAGIVLPGETALLVGGALAASGRVSLPVLLAVAVAAAVLGDTTGYEIGRHGGPALRRSRLGRLVGEARWDRAEQFVARRGGFAVAAGRWVGVARALVPVLAGVTRMPYGRFLVWNVLGGSTWAVTAVLGGYLAGASWPHLAGVLGRTGSVAAAVLVAVVVVVALIRRRRRDGAPAAEPATVGGR
jgi:membrane protein DedA with SNARE-associated domain